jgi:hypothetical protein
MMFTLLLSPPLMMPLNGCGNGVGTTRRGRDQMMCVSSAVTISPCFAAGWTIVTSLSAPLPRERGDDTSSAAPLSRAPGEGAGGEGS